MQSKSSYIHVHVHVPVMAWDKNGGGRRGGEEGKGGAGITVSQLKCSNFTVLVDHRGILKCPVSM